MLLLSNDVEGFLAEENEEDQYVIWVRVWLPHSIDDFLEDLYVSLWNSYKVNMKS